MSKWSVLIFPLSVNELVHKKCQMGNLNSKFVKRKMKLLIKTSRLRISESKKDILSDVMYILLSPRFQLTLFQCFLTDDEVLKFFFNLNSYFRMLVFRLSFCASWRISFYDKNRPSREMKPLHKFDWCCLLEKAKQISYHLLWRIRTRFTCIWTNKIWLQNSFSELNLLIC